MTRKSHHFPVFVSAADVKGDGDVAGGAGAGDAVGRAQRLVDHALEQGRRPHGQQQVSLGLAGCPERIESVFFNWMTRCWACKSRVRSACPC